MFVFRTPTQSTFAIINQNILDNNNNHNSVYGAVIITDDDTSSLRSFALGSGIAVLPASS